jgi:hypothetical protein
MHGLYKSRKKMLASTLHLTTTPADHHRHQEHPDTGHDCPEKHHHPHHKAGKVVLSGPNSAPTPLLPEPKLEPCPVPHQTK